MQRETEEGQRTTTMPALTAWCWEGFSSERFSLNSHPLLVPMASCVFSLGLPLIAYIHTSIFIPTHLYTHTANGRYMYLHIYTFMYTCMCIYAIYVPLYIYVCAQILTHCLPH